MSNPQPGIFALGTTSHAHLEFDAAGLQGPALVGVIASMREPRTTMEGVNLVTDHGTMFVGFSADQRPLAAMLESMVGLNGGTRDALTRYTRPLTGAYYFIPSIESLRAAAR